MLRISKGALLGTEITRLERQNKAIHCPVQLQLRVRRQHMKNNNNLL